MKILVVDDHVLIREALRGVLKELKREAVIIEAADSRQAMQQMADNPDVELVLLDLGLPDRDGLEMLAEIAERYPTSISVVVHSAHQDRDRVMKALDLGALGFIPKSAPREVMLSAFNLIFSGGVYIPPEILDRRQPTPPAQLSSPPQKRRVTAAELGLTERQLEVLGLMMQGKSNKAICRVLNVAEPTVKIHVSAILKALKAANRTEAVMAAAALGLRPEQGSK
jgi:DNA-binding NarL/FixJ family response regulator